MKTYVVEGASNEYLQHRFSSKNKKNIDTFMLKKNALSRAMTADLDIPTCLSVNSTVPIVSVCKP